MPRLAQVSKADAPPEIAALYKTLFGDRDPVAEPGTATGTPGNWWTVFAQVPHVFQHQLDQFRMYDMFGIFGGEPQSTLDPKVRELGITRTGWARESQFVFSQHCKVSRVVKLTEDQIAAIPAWQTSDAFDARERAVLAYTDALVLQGGRMEEATMDALKEHLSDAEVIELTYFVLCYNMHAIASKALRLEYDDVPDRITEVPVPDNG